MKSNCLAENTKKVPVCPNVNAGDMGNSFVVTHGNTS
jgi:hypothetical protein